MTVDVLLLRDSLEPERQDTEQALAWLRDAFEVRDDISMAAAGRLLEEAKRRYQLLETRRTEITAPLLASKRAIDDMFRPLLTKLHEAERILKAKVGQFMVARENERQALMLASAAQYQAGMVPTLAIPTPAAASGISVRRVWDFEVTDPNAVPRAYCKVDDHLIRATIPKEGSPPTIPGVRWYQREQVAVRAGQRHG